MKQKAKKKASIEQIDEGLLTLNSRCIRPRRQATTIALYAQYPQQVSQYFRFRTVEQLRQVFDTMRFPINFILGGRAGEYSATFEGEEVFLIGLMRLTNVTRTQGILASGFFPNHDQPSISR